MLHGICELALDAVKQAVGCTLKRSMAAARTGGKWGGQKAGLKQAEEQGMVRVESFGGYL